jgi:hypothetical protein
VEERVPVQRIVGGINIKDDFLRRECDTPSENPDEQALDSRRIMSYL